MSGGSWDYVSGRIADVVDALRNNTTIENRHLKLNQEQIEKRQKLADLLTRVSTALHEIEWVDSDDTSYPRDTQAIDKVFDFLKEQP